MFYWVGELYVVVLWLKDPDVVRDFQLPSHRVIKQIIV